ncbi:MAG: hypothetical protein Q9195_009012 [Heterodermia aff. obscurata]
MEKTISDLPNVIRNFVTQPQRHEEYSLSASASMVNMREIRDFNDAEGPNDQPVNARGRHLVNGYYYGSSTLVSLLGEIRSLLEVLVKNNTDRALGNGGFVPSQSLEECVTIISNISKFSVLDDRLEFSSDGLPLNLPPKGLLDALIEPYFSQIDCILPIFRKEKVCEAVWKEYEADAHEPNGAWLLCFNNMIVQTLEARSFSSQTQVSVEDWSSSAYSSAMEADLSHPFLVNSRRGLDKLERFLEPKLVNVQALISMCLVALGNFEYKLATLLLHQACFVAKSMGLHQQNAISRCQNPDEEIERINVFWTLYVTDKTISLTTGNSGCLSLHDCDVDLPERDVSNPYLGYVLARIELACIQEDCYRELFSTKALKQDNAERSARILSINHKLDLWAKRHLSFCGGDQAKSDSAQDYSNTAISYYLHSTRVLTQGSSQEANQRNWCREDARICIYLFQKMIRESTTMSNAVILRQIVQDRPLVPFFTLFASVIQDPSSEDSVRDTQLMHLALELLETFHHSNKMHDYTQKLLLVASSCCEVATTIIRSHCFAGMPVSHRMDTCDFPLINRKNPDVNAPPSWEQSPLLFSSLDLPEEPSHWTSPLGDRYP